VNLKQIREECWDLARDVAIVDADRLWTTREMNRYINRIYRWIARETRCIRDSSDVNPTLCQITSDPVDWTTLTVADGLDYTWATTEGAWLYQKDVCPYVYTLSPLILDIDEVKWTTRQWKLNKVSVKKWQSNPWWEQVLGMPTEYATDLANNTLTLNFRSETSDTMRLQVRRLPLVDLVSDTDSPEFRTHYHDYFINGVLWMMYSKQDADVIDKQKSLEYQQMFLRDVDEIKQQEVILDQMLKANHSIDAFR
jgi:hypothetical protein